MTLYRNTSALPLDGFPGGRQAFPGDDIELSDEEITEPLLAGHLQQGVLVPVTLTATEQRDAASAQANASAQK